MGTRSGSNSAAKQLQAQIRRNRQRKNMIASSVVLGVAMLIIGLSVLMYLKNRPQAGEAIAANQQPGAVNGGTTDDTGETSSNRGDDANAETGGKKRDESRYHCVRQRRSSRRVAEDELRQRRR